jgi:hypothetical protein
MDRAGAVTDELGGELGDPRDQLLGFRANADIIGTAISGC